MSSGGGTNMPTERAAPWYLSSEQVENSPSMQYFVRKYGSVERARSREQEARQTTCAFLQESGQKLRLCAAACRPSASAAAPGRLSELSLRRRLWARAHGIFAPGLS